MLIAFLLTAAQPVQAPVPPAGPATPSDRIDVTAGVIAYRDWRLCLDGRLGPPPRRPTPSETDIEAALAECRSYEDALRTATVAAFGPDQGAAIFARMTAEARTEIGAAQ